jgi:hypothetical protein
VATLSSGQRGEESRFAGAWKALEEASTGRGKSPDGRKSKQAVTADPGDPPFADPFFWSGFIYAGY